jgi:5-methylcytosine-specific restriction endonuclease McrA
MKRIPKQILNIVQQLKDGESSRKFKVRAVLKWFGASRRGANVVSDIRTALVGLGLETVPNLDETEIDDPIRFVLSTVSAKQSDAANNPITQGKSTMENVGSSAAQTESETSSNGSEPSHSSSEDQLEPETEDEQPISKPDDRPVTSQGTDWTISSLRDKLERGQLDLQPKFQREYVWDQRPELPSRLIESALLEIPIPPIYFGRVAEGRLEIIDGQQRLTTLVNFVTNKFPLRRLHSMPSLNHKFFKELSEQQQEKILDTPIRSIVIDAGRNTELRYEVFERLNRGSMQLNEQELRNCVYRGPFNDLLAELEHDSYWRKIKGGETPERRYKEREIVLRFFAFANRLANYTGSLKRFLNEYIGQYAPKESQELKAHTNLFRQTMQNIYAVFGEKAGRFYEVNPRTNRGAWEGKFSVTAFDIQAAALMNRPPAKVQQAAEQIRELFLFTMLTDLELQDAVSKRTGSTSQTKARWTKFRSLVDSIIDGIAVESRFFDYGFRQELYQQSQQCKLCGNEIHTFDDSTVDHVTPYSKGGKTVPANAQLAHRGCNARKNAQMPAAFTTSAK